MLGMRDVGLSANVGVTAVNTDQVNKWLTVGANIAVVAGIVFLALQLNQNSRMVQTQTRNAITESILDFQFNAEMSGLADIARKGNQDASSLTVEETQKLFTLYVANLRLWENIHYQYRNGVFDEDEFTAERNSWKNRGARSPLLRSAYCQLKQGGLSPAFVAEMDELAYGDPSSCDTKLNVFATPAAAQP